jgi:hypothetical protein
MYSEKSQPRETRRQPRVMEKAAGLMSMLSHSSPARVQPTQHKPGLPIARLKYWFIKAFFNQQYS